MVMCQLTQKNRIDKIGDKLSLLESSGKGVLTRFDIMTGRSGWYLGCKIRGIDPANGKSYTTIKWDYTYDFSYDNEVICGNIIRK